MSTPRLMVASTAAETAQRAAKRFLRIVRTELRQRDLVHLCLTGGTMGIAVLREIAEHPDAEGLDWSRLHFWWGDERFVAADHDDRNALQARRALLDRVPVPAQNIHEMAASDAGLTLDEAAAAYAAELAAFGSDELSWPVLSLCFLGMGPDGHIASLFPGRAELAERDAAALPVRNSPKPPPERVTLTLPVINTAERIWLVVGGVDKAPALQRLLEAGASEQTPASLARGVHETLIFADASAVGS